MSKSIMYKQSTVLPSHARVYRVHRATHVIFNLEERGAKQMPSLGHILGGWEGGSHLFLLDHDVLCSITMIKYALDLLTSFEALGKSAACNRFEPVLQKSSGILKIAYGNESRASRKKHCRACSKMMKWGLGA